MDDMRTCGTGHMKQAASMACFWLGRAWPERISQDNFW
jgi:hypothetical protein